MFGHRPPTGPVPDRATRIIVGANVVIFVLQMFAGARWLPVVETFALSADGLRSGALWQLVTYQFLHANELHILMNMLGLWFAGRELERVVGTPRFVALYLSGGVIAGLAQMTLSPAGGPLIGASGSVFAVLLALTTLFPGMPVTALLFFVLPVRMRARTLGLGLVGVSVAFWLSGLEPEVGHLAHLGGCATGWAFGMAFRRRFGDDGTFSTARREDHRPPPLPGESAFLRPVPSMDEILAKVLRHGIESLTPEERRILEESRRPRR